MAHRSKGTVPWKIWVPAELALRIELRYLDPVTGKPKYAARSHIITALLMELDRELATLDDIKPGLVGALLERLATAGETEERKHA